MNFGFEKETTGEIILGDGKKYILKPRDVLIVKNDSQTGDWKTATARNIPILKSGTKVRFVKIWSNFYGWWITVYPLAGRESYYYDLRAHDLIYASVDNNEKHEIKKNEFREILEHKNINLVDIREELLRTNLPKKIVDLFDQAGGDIAIGSSDIILVDVKVDGEISFDSASNFHGHYFAVSHENYNWQIIKAENMRRYCQNLNDNPISEMKSGEWGWTFDNMIQSSLSIDDFVKEMHGHTRQ